MELVVLGTAAGGGFPQWNCICTNCESARLGTDGIFPRLQSSIAVRGIDGPWHLVNVSPDISRQIEQFLPRLKDNSRLRHSPVASVFLTNADLDHCLGLFTLREGEEVRVVAPDGVRSSLIRDLHIDDILGSYNGLRWAFASPDWAPVDASGLESRALPLSHAEAPKYAHLSREEEVPRCHGVGYQFRHRDHAGVVGVFPDVGWIDHELLRHLDECDVVFFDGTFWSDDEMPALGLGSRTARDMGHIPMTGQGGSIAALSQLTDTVVYFQHINNTNPALRPNSPERQIVASHGMHIAEDGMRVTWNTDSRALQVTLPKVPTLPLI